MHHLSMYTIAQVQDPEGTPEPAVPEVAEPPKMEDGVSAVLAPAEGCREAGAGASPPGPLRSGLAAPCNLDNCTL